MKAVTADPALKSRVLALLKANKIEAATVSADVELCRSRLLSFSTFRKKVNPLFYQSGEDQQACANCHGNHTILRIAEAARPGEDGIQQLMINYNSALKVVNLGEPEASLILRKPRSPHGQGGADSRSTTGLTHVGGTRWEGTESPAYKAMLDWIRDASRSAAGRAHAETYSTDSYSPGYEPAAAGDGDLSTIWHTEFVGASPGYPHELVVDLGACARSKGCYMFLVRIVPTDGSRTSRSGPRPTAGRGAKLIASGRWENDTTFKYVPLDGTPARYVQLRGLSEVEGRPFMSAAEVSRGITAAR